MHQFAVEALVINAFGLTLAVTLNGVPAHPATDGVTIYTTSIGSVVMFTRVSVIAAVIPLPVFGVIPLTDALFHTKVAVPLLLVAVYVVDVFVHLFGGVAELVITAVGLTVTATSFTVPAQLFTVGVIR